MLDTLILTARICVIMLALFAAYEDVRYLRIRNPVALAVAVLFVPVAFTLTWQGLAVHATIAAIVLAVGFALFAAGLFGGGDAKLLAALALWLPPAALPPFLLVMAFAGGAVALAALALRHVPALAQFLPVLAAKCGDKSWFAALARGETVVPYGIAIAVATIVVFLKL